MGMYLFGPVFRGGKFSWDEDPVADIIALILLVAFTCWGDLVFLSLVTCGEFVQRWTFRRVNLLCPPG